MTFPEKFVKHFTDLYDEYTHVKKALILAENLDPENKVLIAPLNQLRSALDHAFKATVTENEEKIGHELNEFREHVRRAGYDSFEFLASSMGLNLVKKVRDFSNECITTVFPDYYISVRPQLVQMRLDIAELRAEKNHDKKPFKGYIKQIGTLIEIDKRVQATIPTMEEYERKKKEEEKRQSRKNVKNGVIVALISIVVTLVLNNIFDKKDSSPKATTTTNTPSVPSPDSSAVDTNQTAQLRIKPNN